MSQSSTATADLHVEVERQPGAEARLTVTAGPDEVAGAVARALAQLAHRVRVPGFRPGRAPAAVVERAVGWSAVQQEAIDLLLPEVYRRALDQTGLDPVAQPKVEEVALERDQPFTLVVSLVLRPEVVLGDYHAIRIPLQEVEVPEAEVDGTLGALRQRYAQLTDASDREVQANDVVTAALTMRHGDEVVGTAGQVQTLDLERGDLLPGMGDQLLGARVGPEPVQLVLTLPDEYPREDLRGELVEIEAVLTAIQAKELPALDDNLAAIAGHGETLEELRGFVREQLREELRAESDRDQVAKVMQALLDLAKVDVPEVMIQAEIDHQVRDLEARLSQSGIPLEALLSAQGSSLEQLRGERRQPAVERVRLELALGQVAKQEGLTVAPEEIDQALLSLLPKGTSRDARQRAREPVSRELLTAKARDLLIHLARGEEDREAKSDG